ncbi:hypothetical protein D3C86_473960 [compost metagenome]
MQEIICLQLAIHDKRASSIEAAHRLVGKARALIIIRTEVKICCKLAALGFHPPLPGHGDILNIDIRPFLRAGYFAVHIISKAMPGIEVGCKISPLDYGAFSDIGRHAVPVRAGSFNIGQIYFRIPPCIRRVLIRTRPPGTIADEGHPLIVVISPAVRISSSEVLIQRILGKISSECGDAVHRLTLIVEIQAQVILLLPSPKVTVPSFNARKDGLQRVKSQAFCMLAGAFQLVFVPPVVQEYGI